MEILRELKSQGVTCIYISHKLEEFFRINRYRVGPAGWEARDHPAHQGPHPGEARGSDGGSRDEGAIPKGHRKPGEVFFKVEDLHAMDPANPGREVLKGVSLDLRKGEILGIAGLMGSGRTELVSTLFGEYARVVKGRIELDGKEIAIGSAREAMSHGISLVRRTASAWGWC